jgi:LacI family transcriptional regulator
MCLATTRAHRVESTGARSNSASPEAATTAVRPLGAGTSISNSPILDLLNRISIEQAGVAVLTRRITSVENAVRLDVARRGRRERLRSSVAVANRRPTLADVARKAGVSETAASFVLNGRTEMRLSAAVHDRVQQAAEEIGYRPNIISRSLRFSTTRTIAFVSDSIATTPFAGELIHGATDAAHERGNLLFIAETEADPVLELELIEALLDRQVDGIIYASMYTREVIPPKALEGVPLVLLNAVANDGRSSAVIPDGVSAGRSAADVLLDAGFREGVYLVGGGPRFARAPKDSLAARERYVGISEAFKNAGAKLSGCVELPEWEPENGYEATRTLLHKRQTPRALICFNDRLAVGAYRALEEASLKIPTNVSIISFDDDRMASWLKPQLTTLALPHYELGRTAIEMLFGNDTVPIIQKTPRVQRVPMPLRIRDSVLAPGSTNTDS